MKRRKGDHERGQVLVLVAFALVGIIALISLTIDLSFWRYQQRIAQTAADAAAMAGAQEGEYSKLTANISAAALGASSANGFTNGAASTTVTVNTPPLSGPNIASPGATEVIVARAEPTFFSAVLGRRFQNISARAVAIQTTAGMNCIYALDTGGGAITENGSTMSLPQCGIIANGNLTFNQGSVDAAMIGYAGTSSNNLSAVYPHARPTPSVVAADPCPSIPGCAYLTANPPTSGPCVTPQPSAYGPGAVTLSPGRYCNQVLFNSTTTIVFSPGVYDFSNGLTVNGSVSTVTGNGVTFYITNQQFILPGNPTVNLSAPISGNTAGVLMYSPTTGVTLNGGAGAGTGGYAGALYFPQGTVIVNGQHCTWTLVIAKDVLLNSNSGVTYVAAPGITNAVLAE